MTTEPTNGYPSLVAVVLDALDARRLAEFYRQLLGYSYRPGDEPPADPDSHVEGAGWLVLFDPSGQPRLAFQEVDEIQAVTWPEGKVPQQLHLDFTVATPAELSRQNERAVQLGARVLEDRSDSDEETLIVYADPEGHPFCMLVV